MQLSPFCSAQKVIVMTVLGLIVDEPDWAELPELDVVDPVVVVVEVLPPLKVNPDPSSPKSLLKLDNPPLLSAVVVVVTTVWVVITDTVLALVFRICCTLIIPFST